MWLQDFTSVFFSKLRSHFNCIHCSWMDFCGTNQNMQNNTCFRFCAQQPRKLLPENGLGPKHPQQWGQEVVWKMEITFCFRMQNVDSNQYTVLRMFLFCELHERQKHFLFQSMHLVQIIRFLSFNCCFQEVVEIVEPSLEGTYRPILFQ